MSIGKSAFAKALRIALRAFLVCPTVARSPGHYTVHWDGTDDTGRAVASGVYLCRMEAGDYSAVRKLVLVH